jgi:hypothetical protein
MSRGFIAGPYIWTFNGRTVGITENGFRLSQVAYGDPVKGDNLGDSIQDFVYRGGDVSVEGTFQEYNCALNGVATDGPKVNLNCASVFWPYANYGLTGQIGRMASLVAAPLVGTPAPGTSAASTLVKTITMVYAVLPPNFDVSVLFAARLRNVPIRLQALPWPIVDFGTETWFSLT